MQQHLINLCFKRHEIATPLEGVMGAGSFAIRGVGPRKISKVERRANFFQSAH